MLDIKNLQQEYYKLTQAQNDSEVREEIEHYDGENSVLMQHYVLEIDENYSPVIKNFEVIKDQIERSDLVETVLVIGNGSGETRCYSNKAPVFVLKDGTIWMDCELHDEVFA